jgi:hypothetical protein
MFGHLGMAIPYSDGLQMMTPLKLHLITNVFSSATSIEINNIRPVGTKEYS